MFKATEAKELPVLVCMGEVKEFDNPALTKSGNYINQPFAISSLGAGLPIKGNLYYHPTWLLPDFDPDQLESTFFYKKQLMSMDIGVTIDPEGKRVIEPKPPGGTAEVSQLMGLCGSYENFVVITDKIQSLPVESDADGNVIGPKPEVVAEVLRELVGNQVGYVLAQRMQDTGEMGLDGRKVKIRSNIYEIRSFFWPSKKSVEAWQKRCAKEPGKTRMCFDTDVPFSSGAFAGNN